MAKVKREYTSTAVLELPLQTEKWQIEELNKRLEVCRKMYNSMLTKELKKYREMIKTREWREIQKALYEEYGEQEQDKEDSGEKKKKHAKSKKCIELEKSRNEIIRNNGFSEYDFYSRVADFNAWNALVSSNTAINSVAAPMWSAFERLLYKNGNMVHFKKKDGISSMASDNKSGIRLKQDEAGRYYILLSNRRYTKKVVCLFIKSKSLNLYEREMLDARCKGVRIIRKEIKGKDVFYVQLSMQCKPVIKYNADGSVRHPLNEGQVAMALWRNQLCAVSKDKVYITELSPLQNQYEIKREDLTREMERLRRLHNPQNFNEDGTIKKGTVDELGHKQRLQWHYSNHYLELKKQKKDLERVNKEQKKIRQYESLMPCWKWAIHSGLPK